MSNRSTLPTILRALSALVLFAPGPAAAEAGAPSAPSCPESTACASGGCPPGGAEPSSFCEADADGRCTDMVSSSGGWETSLPPWIHRFTPESTKICTVGTEILGGLGCGRLCCAVVATASQDIPLYRAWAPHYPKGATVPSGYVGAYQFSHWWSYEEPDETSRARYRVENEVCVNYDSLTVYTQCTLIKGTQVVIGRGQSACCDRGVYLLESPTLQIYVPAVEGSEGTQGHFRDCDSFVWRN